MKTEESVYMKLRSINVNEHIEKKNNLSYLSWAWAVDVLLQNDPAATWEYLPSFEFKDGTMMVRCAVTAFGKTMTSQLPVMDYKNKAIPNPDAFAVNTAMQRCLAKAIALHGLGLYIYAGEDLPDGGDKSAGMTQERIAELIAMIKAAETPEEKRDLVKSTAAECKSLNDVDAYNQIKKGIV